MASSAARPAPLSETPGPCNRPSGSMEISSLLRGARTVSRCAVSATYGPSDEFLQAFNSSGFPIEQRTYNNMLQATQVNNAQYNYPATGNNGRIPPKPRDSR